MMLWLVVQITPFLGTSWKVFLIHDFIKGTKGWAPWLLGTLDLGHLGSWALGHLGLLGSWALGCPELLGTLGTWALEHLGLLSTLGSWSLGHLG
jgi:hypothetical protein